MSIFNDKALKSVAEAASKIMAQEASHPKTDKEKDLAAMGHPKDKITRKDVLIGRGVLKKEEKESCEDEAEEVVDKHEKKMHGKKGEVAKHEKEMHKEEVEQLDEYQSKGGVYTHKGTYGTEKSAEAGYTDYDKENDLAKKMDKPKASRKLGARQNYVRATRVNESFTQMIAAYQEKGLKALAEMSPVEEEVDSETYEKEMKDQKAKFDGKKKGGDVAKASVQAVKQEETHKEIQVIDMTDPDNIKKETISIEEAKKMKGEDPCWKDYEMVGMKNKNGRKVPNCVPKNEEVEQIDEISRDLAQRVKDKASSSQLHHLTRAHKIISKTKDIPVLSTIGKFAAQPDVEKAERRKRQANMADRKLGGQGQYKYDDKGNYGREGPAKVLAKEEVEVDLEESVFDFKGFDKITKGEYPKHDKIARSLTKTAMDTNKISDHKAAIKAHKAAITKLPHDSETYKGAHNSFIDDHQQAINKKRNVSEEIDLNERTLTEPEAKKKEEVVMSMKKKLPSFKERYGDRAKEVIYATATKTAKEKA